MSNIHIQEFKQLLNDLILTKDLSAIGLDSTQLRDLEIKLRRMRNDVFPAGYFSDFGWDILLELDKAARQNRRYVVTDAGAETGIPLTTTIRYIAKLERDGYVQRETDPADRRRCFVSLTTMGKEALETIFSRTVGNMSTIG